MNKNFGFNLLIPSLTQVVYQIAREMVISPQNSRLGLTALTKRVGLMDRPDSPDAELIRYRVCTSFSKVAEIAYGCIPSHVIFDNAFHQLIFFLFFFFFCDVSGMTLK